MLASVRALLVAVLLALSTVVLTQTSAQAACTCVANDLEKDADRAEVIFEGVLVKQTGDQDKRTKLDVRAETLYKGDLATPEVRVVTAGNRCGLGDLKVDESYIFFASLDGGKLSAGQCGGTDRATASFTDKVVKLLGEGEKVQHSVPEERPAEFEQVAGAQPEEFSRLAAPGGALALVGLLGLFFVRRRAGS